jgi:hypothetical protein
MKFDHHVRRAFLLLGAVAALPACVQTPVEQSHAATAERVSLLTSQLRDFERYTTQMEKQYAAQEAEILALRDQVASLSSSQ